MSTQRILVSPNRIAISRRGYDVVSPPAITNEFLSVDSSFSLPVRLAVSGIAFNRSGANFGTVPYGITFATPPFIQCMPYNAGTPAELVDLFMKWVGGSPDNYYTPFSFQISLSSFSMGVTGTNRDANYDNALRNWIFFVWNP
jgi:hypothetical protein